MSKEIEDAGKSAAIEYSCAFADWVAVDEIEAIENFVRLNISILSIFYRDSRVDVMNILKAVYEDLAVTEFEDFEDLVSYFEERFKDEEDDA